jgi:CRISPR/Cas system CSM-associated protein Csm2 small subunit/tetrahydromethanopterin S-methyltransferase subunit B
MDTTNEMNQHELVNEVELSVQTEVIDEKELEKRAIDTITTLVNQANIISTENIPVDEMILYEDVDDPKTYIGKIEEHESKAKENYTELEKMKKAHFWTIGRNKAKVEQTQIVLEDIIKAINNNANATKALFNKYAKLAEYSNILYGIGIMGIASNRIVVREIKKRLEHASQEELNELARHELESVVYELQQQQRLERKVDENHKNAIEKIESISKTVISNTKQLDMKFSQVNELINQQVKKVDENHKNAIDKIESIKKTVISNTEHLDKKINEETESVNKQIKQIVENYNELNSIIDSYDKRLCLLEKRSIFDSTIYKIIVGITAIGAFIISIISYLF